MMHHIPQTVDKVHMQKCGLSLVFGTFTMFNWCDFYLFKSS